MKEKIRMKHMYIIGLGALLLIACQTTSENPEEIELVFHTEMVDFSPATDNPVFSGSAEENWDSKIRERGFILKEDEMYHMWYTGFRDFDYMSLGYATSADGIHWERDIRNPIFKERWTEDMMVVKVDSLYQMFAEGKNDIAHRLISSDGIKWTDMGDLDIRYTNGEKLSKGAFGTPTAWYEDNVWYLFYERGDLGIWLATSTDLLVWTNVQDEPVIAMGPEVYDQYGLAVNQIVKYKGLYYAYYHGTAFDDWHDWTSNVAVSSDLIFWKKYEKNPILKENKSSPILVPDGDKFRLYSMHDRVFLHLPKE